MRVRRADIGFAKPEKEHGIVARVRRVVRERALDELLSQRAIEGRPTRSFGPVFPLGHDPQLLGALLWREQTQFHARDLGDRFFSSHDSRTSAST